ncbi:MAG: arginase family protein [Paracoccaceae bacterium]
MSDGFFIPVPGLDLPRFAGIPTFMRLPHVPFQHLRFAKVEVGLIGPKRYCLIGIRGIRGIAYCREDWDFAAANGNRIIPVEEVHAREAGDVMAEARQIVGQGPFYVTYDIDFIDPTFAPGTGTPEVGGPSSWVSVQVALGLRGLDIVGADLVELWPPFDASGGTAWLGVSLMFEMPCSMAGALPRSPEYLDQDEG